MKFAVIGGGFIGCHLSQELLRLGHSVNIFNRTNSRSLEYLKQNGAKLFFGNFLTPDDFRQALIDCDIAFHLISTTVPKTSIDNPVYDIETNVVGTLYLLEEARKAKVKKIIFASSGGTVYGIPQEIPIKESHLTNPISSYGISKLMIEKYLHLYWILHKLDYCILRIANAYGEKQPITETQGVISTFLDKVYKQEKLHVWGDGSVIRDYIYISDVVKALVQATNSLEGPKIFNIGSGQGYSLNDIINIIKSIVRQPIQTEYEARRLFDVPVNVLDISLAKTYLKWAPSVELFEGISRTYTWVTKEKMNCYRICLEKQNH